LPYLHLKKKPPQLQYKWKWCRQ